MFAACVHHHRHHHQQQHTHTSPLRTVDRLGVQETTAKLLVDTFVLQHASGAIQRAPKRLELIAHQLNYLRAQPELATPDAVNDLARVLVLPTTRGKDE